MNIKQYSSSLEYIRTIKNVKNELSITSQVNSGPGRLSIALDTNYFDNLISYGDVIKVFDLDINNIEVCLYSGTVEDIIRYAGDYEEVVIECIGFTGLLTKLIYNEEGVYTITKTGTVSDILNDILDYFDIQYPGYITNRMILSTTETVSYEIKFDNIYKIIKELIELEEDSYFILEANGTFIFNKKVNSEIKRVIFEKDVFELKNEEDGTDIINQIIVKYKNDNVAVYNYGGGPLRTVILDNPSIIDEPTAEKYSNAYYNEASNPKSKLEVAIRNDYKYNTIIGSFITNLMSYYLSQPISLILDKQLNEGNSITNDIYSINPGDKIKILNFGEIEEVEASGESIIFDTDAESYISNVENADGESLEYGIKLAINNFIVGLKTDGIWQKVKASCVMIGARTLSGALTPLSGPAPTNINFLSNDYNRLTGLKGNGTTKYINTNRNNNADPQNNQHIALYITEADVGSPLAGIGLMGATNISSGTSNLFTLGDSYSNGGGGLGDRSRNSAWVTPPTSNNRLTGFVGLSRGISTGYTSRAEGNNYARVMNSQVPYSGNIAVFGRGIEAQTNARIAFYSIGEHIELVDYDTRVTALINDINTGINIINPPVSTALSGKNFFMVKKQKHKNKTNLWFEEFDNFISLIKKDDNLK